MNLKDLNQISINTWIGLVIVGVVLVIVLRFTAKSKEEKKEEEDTAKKELSESNTIKELERKGIKLSYPVSKYIDMANQLFHAMDGLGSNEAAVYSVFKQLKNDADFVALVSNFGTRKGQALSAWIHDDLSVGIISELNGIMKKKGITYKI